MAAKTRFDGLADVLLESQRIAAGALKEFDVNVTIFPTVERFLNDLNITFNSSAVGRDLIHVEIHPEVKAGGVTA